MKDELSIHLIRSVLRDLTGLFADRARTEAEIDRAAALLDSRSRGPGATGG